MRGLVLPRRHPLVPLHTLHRLRNIKGLTWTRALVLVCHHQDGVRRLVKCVPPSDNQGASVDLTLLQRHFDIELLLFANSYSST